MSRFTANPSVALELTPVFSVAHSLVFCVVFCRSSFGHCIVCPSLIFGFCLLLLYLQTFFTISPNPLLLYRMVTYICIIFVAPSGG